MRGYLGVYEFLDRGFGGWGENGATSSGCYGYGMGGRTFHPYWMSSGRSTLEYWLGA